MSASLERLLPLLKQHIFQELTLADITVSDPQLPEIPAIVRNTQVIVMGTGVSQTVKGRMTYYYDRLDLSTVFQGLPVQVTGQIGELLNSYDLVDRLVARYGLELDHSDVKQSGDFEITEYPTKIKIFAADNSYGWFGEVEVEVVELAPALEDGLLITTLSGLNPPCGDITRAQGPVYSWDFKVPASKLDTAKGFVHGQVADAIMLDFVNGIPLQPWVLNDGVVNNNLKGARVVYNGPYNSNPDIQVYYPGNALNSNALIIELTVLCKNVGGYLIFGYE